MMNKRLIPLILVLVALTFNSCQENKVDDTTPSIIPVPVSLEMGTGSFPVQPGLEIYCSSESGQATDVARYLAEWLSSSFAATFPLVTSPSQQKMIFLDLYSEKDPEIGEEGYDLITDTNRVTIRANTPAGLFYGVQTFLQLLPPKVFSGQYSPESEWSVPCLTIKDYPRYSWRGMHLDVSRHFFPLEFIKRYIDLIAMHKMNIFHWHLTDDNGWRIEIKKYPLLTDVAAWRVDREDRPWRERELQKPGEEATYGGYYKQEEILEVIKYAADRHITIIPEIEMPGHSSEVFAAYPEYSCRGEKLTVQPGSYWPNTDIFCAGKEETFQFLEDVLTEVADLFPSEYIHIGGDEADKTEWKRCPKCQKRIKNEGLDDEDELQSYFIKRIEKVLQSKGKKLIGWDEILEGGLAPEATVMSWRGFEGGIEAARMGHDVIMCPTSHCYFDYYQGDPETEPEAIGGYLTLKKVYSFRPTPPVLNENEAKHILGAQGNVWTEYIPTPEHAEYMAVPRMTALAEVVWSPEEKLDWQDFRERLVHQFERLDAMGVNYCEGSYQVSAMPSFDADRYSIALEAEAPGAVIHYTLDGSDPVLSSSKYSTPIQVHRDVAIKALAFKENEPKGKLSEIPISYHKAIGKPYSSEHPPSFKYKGDNESAMVDGIHGSEYYNDGKWLGFQGDNMDITIDLGEVKETKHFEVSFLHDQKRWIFIPEIVRFYFSEDGKDYFNLTKENSDFDLKTEETVIYPIEFEFENLKRVRYVRVEAMSQGTLPDWHPSAGGQAWIFADEIVIK